MNIGAYRELEHAVARHTQAEEVVHKTLGFPRSSITWRNVVSYQTDQGLQVEGDDVTLKHTSQVVVYDLKDGEVSERWAVCYD